MAQSPEYPDLRWIEPKAWGEGRDGKSVRYIVIHYTAGSEGPTSAEDGALYNARRTDGTSAHYFVDPDSVVQGVRTRDRANCARHRGNRLGIQYELCGTAQTRAQWQDAASLPTLRNAARQAARDCRKHGIPVRRLTVAETRKAWVDYPNGPTGFVGHVDCTYAYPEDGGDHTDPGTGFPWDLFLDMVRAELEGDEMNATETTSWARSDDGAGALRSAVLEAELGRGDTRRSVAEILAETRSGVAALQSAATAEAGRDAQVAAILAGMQTALSALAGATGALTPEQLTVLLQQVRQAAQQAGAEAVSALTAQVASLREHLGDDA